MTNSFPGDRWRRAAQFGSRRAYVALGRANHVAVVDVKARKVEEYLLVGKRAWGWP